MNELVLPRYGRASVADVLPSIAAHLGLAAAGVPALDLPSANRYVVVLVDGLGHQLLQRALALAPWCADRIGGSAVLTATVPSTTATSLTSLGTGRPPGQHGVVGYAFRDRVGGEVFNALTWNTAAVPEQVQCCPTWFEQLGAAGHQVTAVVPQRFDGSGLTRAALRGQVVSAMVDESDEQDRITRTVAASRQGSHSLVYVYERMLDHTGHALGVAHDAWGQQLSRIDAFLGRLREALDDDVVMLVTGDHGMVDVPTERRIILEEHPELLQGLAALAGEGRFRQLYTDHPDGVAERWAELLGDRAWVRRRDEALDQGWFGENPDPAVTGRIGDVVVAMRQDWALMSTTLPGELGLVGMHGSLTAAEMLVPLLVDAGGQG